MLLVDWRCSAGDIQGIISVIRVFVFIEQVLDRFFKEIILSLFKPGGEDFDFLNQIRIYGGIIHLSFAHNIFTSYRNIGNYIMNFRKKNEPITEITRLRPAQGLQAGFLS